MTADTGPRVTVVIVALPGQEGENGPLMHAVHSVEQQTYPRDLVDTHIVRNVEVAPLADMQAVGVAHADTEFVAFLNPTQPPWEPEVLAQLVDGILENPGTYIFGGTGLGKDQRSYGTIMRRDYYLQHRSELGAVS
jgi:hypothetical protein